MGCGLAADCRSRRSRTVGAERSGKRMNRRTGGGLSEFSQDRPKSAKNCRKLPEIAENFSEILRGFARNLPSFPSRHVCWGFRLPPRPATINVKVWHGGLVADCRSDPPREWRTGCGLAVKISADCRTKNKVTSLPWNWEVSWSNLAYRHYQRRFHGLHPAKTATF